VLEECCSIHNEAMTCLFWTLFLLSWNKALKCRPRASISKPRVPPPHMDVEVGVEELFFGGESFNDYFQSHNPKIWSSKHRRLSCQGPLCVLQTRRNVIYNPYGGVHLSFKNNCYGVDCCTPKPNGAPYKKGDCTSYTVGRLTSVKAYSYGSFRWQAQTTYDISRVREFGFFSGDRTLEVPSCFRLYSGDEENPKINMAMCVSNTSPHKIDILYDNGETKIQKQFKLHFDASKKMADYRIDYHPCYVKYYVNDEVYLTINAIEVNVPYAHLSINMGMQAARNQLQFDNDVSFRQRDIEMRMKILKFEYVRNEGDTNNIIHDEPFTDNHSASNRMPLFFIFAFVFLSWIMIHCCCPTSLCRQKMDSSHYVLMNTTDT